jgi:hypothetical protein
MLTNFPYQFHQVVELPMNVTDDILLAGHFDNIRLLNKNGNSSLSQIIELYFSEQLTIFNPGNVFLNAHFL